MIWAVIRESWPLCQIPVSLKIVARTCSFLYVHCACLYLTDFFDKYSPWKPRRTVLKTRLKRIFITLEAASSAVAVCWKFCTDLQYIIISCCANRKRPVTHKTNIYSLVQQQLYPRAKTRSSDTFPEGTADRGNERNRYRARRTRYKTPDQIVFPEISYKWCVHNIVVVWVKFRRNPSVRLRRTRLNNMLCTQERRVRDYPCKPVFNTAAAAATSTETTALNALWTRRDIEFRRAFVWYYLQFLQRSGRITAVRAA